MYYIYRIITLTTNTKTECLFVLDCRFIQREHTV